MCQKNLLLEEILMKEEMNRIIKVNDEKLF